MNDTKPVCDYEGSDYQTSFWDKGDRAYEDQVEAAALSNLLPRQGKLLLELGAGAGRNTNRYSGFERIILVDYSITQLQQARQRLGISPRYGYVCANIYHLPFVSGLFDAATMIRTIHHMADAPFALAQVRSTLKENAVFILEYANKQNIKAILRYLLRRQKWNPFSLEPVEFADLNFDFHPKAIRLWLETNGFCIEQQVTVSHYRIGWMKKLIPLNILVSMDKLAQKTGNLWQLSPSVFVRSRAAGSTQPASDHHFYRCPKCEHFPLPDTPPELICPVCKTTYQVKDGIYDLRVT